MDPQTWEMMRTLARYVIALAGSLLVGALVAMGMIILLLPDSTVGKVAIVAGIAGAISGGLSLMLGAVGGAFVAMVNQRRNISVNEAQGGPDDESAPTPTPTEPPAGE